MVSLDFIIIVLEKFFVNPVKNEFFSENEKNQE
jgi:hypothetical protein